MLANVHLRKPADWQPVRVPLDELVALYAGCDLTDGYPTLELGFRICEQSAPGNRRALRHTVYGPVNDADVDPVGRRTLDLSFDLWVRAGCPTARG